MLYSRRLQGANRVVYYRVGKDDFMRSGARVGSTIHLSTGHQVRST